MLLGIHLIFPHPTYKMNTIDAKWEMRNLGVETVEITIEAADDAESLTQDLSRYEKAYTIVKVPVGHGLPLFNLHKMGYSFIETLTQCYHLGASFNLNPIQKRIAQISSSSLMTLEETSNLYREIQAGIFGTDRISLDPRFGPDVANQRYAYWLQDEIERGSKIYKVEYQHKTIGFFALKMISADVCFSFLAGLYTDFVRSGLGFCPHWHGLMEGFRLGAKRVLTTYSSNNRGAAALHMAMGHCLISQYYVFIKHCF